MRTVPVSHVSQKKEPREPSPWLFAEETGGEKMSDGSYCENCGYRTERIMLVCPRCRGELRHAQCRQCGRCPGGHGKETSRQVEKP
jgi:hypothetical protein